MSKSITLRDAQKLKNQVTNLKKASARAREKAGEATERLLMAAEVGGTAFAFGQIQARYGGVVILGVPSDLGLGVLANVASLLGVGRGMEAHLANIGNGALASYAFRSSYNMGVESMTKAKKAIPTQATRILGDSDEKISGESLADIDYADLAAPIEG